MTRRFRSHLIKSAARGIDWFFLHVISPLDRTPEIAAGRVAVVAGEVDQVTGVTHARAFSRHFAAPLVDFPGGHLLQFGQRDAIAAAMAHVDAPFSG